MTRYIDKDALVAEIEKLVNNYDKALDYEAALEDVRNFIDSLEVKKVDLEKEFDDYTKDIMACDVQFEPFTHMYNCAKHFFELGLKAQKGE